MINDQDPKPAEPRVITGPGSPPPPQDVAWALLAEADAEGDAVVEEILTEALATLSPPAEAPEPPNHEPARSWRVILPRVRVALAAALSPVHGRPASVRAARAAHVLDRMDRRDGPNGFDAGSGPARTPVRLRWPEDESFRSPMPPLLDDAWWFLCAADATAVAAVENRLRDAIAVLLDGSSYELAPEPPQTIAWQEAVRCAVGALDSYAESTDDPVEVLRAGRTAAVLDGLSHGDPA